MRERYGYTGHRDGYTITKNGRIIDHDRVYADRRTADTIARNMNVIATRRRKRFEVERFARLMGAILDEDMAAQVRSVH